MARFMIQDRKDNITLYVNNDVMQFLSEITQKPLSRSKRKHLLNVELSPEAIRGFDHTVKLVDDYWLKHTK